MTSRPFWSFALLLITTTIPLRAADEKNDDKPADKPLIAHVTLSGDLDEAPAGESAFGSTAAENLKQKLDRIAKAKADPKVKALLLEIDGLQLGLFGFGKVNEVRAAVADFRKAGKKAYAYLPEVAGLDYLIACACDQVILPESGGFGLTGLHLEVSFYKNLFDKVHADARWLPFLRKLGKAPEQLAKIEFKVTLPQ